MLIPLPGNAAEITIKVAQQMLRSGPIDFFRLRSRFPRNHVKKDIPSRQGSALLALHPMLIRTYLNLKSALWTVPSVSLLCSGRRVPAQLLSVFHV
jgi:hypothetical protein